MFLATVSHELRTPLTAILGFSALLRSTSFDQDELLEPIERNAKDMHQMVERLLDLLAARGLIGNAAKYSDAPATIRVAARPSGHGVVDTVTDEARGSPPSTTSRSSTGSSAEIAASSATGAPFPDAR